MRRLSILALVTLTAGPALAFVDSNDHIQGGKPMAQSLKAPQVSLDLSELDIRERRSIRNPNPSALGIPADALRTSELGTKERRSIRNPNPE